MTSDSQSVNNSSVIPAEVTRERGDEETKLRVKVSWTPWATRVRRSFVVQWTGHLTGV